jgi:gliding motility-associated-like protein
VEAIENQAYQLIIVHDNGCIALAAIDLNVLPEPAVYIPNAFSPNGDGANDYFTLYANDQIEEIKTLSIFDRWGEYVFGRNGFKPNEPLLGWDGWFKGELMNPAVFVYFFEVKMKDGSTRFFSGDVTLLK